MTEDLLLAALQSQTERTLTETVLVPLFVAIGYHRVTLEGGSHEAGRDIVCWGTNELGETKIAVVQVKRFRPDAQVSSPRSLRATLFQIEQSLEHAVTLPDGTTRSPTEAILVTPFPLSQRTLNTVRHELPRLHQQKVTIVDGPKLAALISAHLPLLAGRLMDPDQSKRRADDAASRHGDAQTGDDQRYADLLDFLSAMRADIDRKIGPTDPIDPELCFVIMSFSSNPVLRDFYEKAVKPTVEKLGYRCERVDEQHFNDSITERIFHNLRTAKIIVADLTEARPNCYYELGIAHALRKEVIHLAYSGQDIHFDVKDWNFIIYSRIDELTRKLRERILATVGRGGAGTGDG